METESSYRKLFSVANKTPHPLLLLLPMMMMIMHQTSINCAILCVFRSNANHGQMQNAAPDGRLRAGVPAHACTTETGAPL